MKNGKSSPMHIMLAVDGSEHSLAAVQLVCDLPLPRDSFVSAVAVLIPREAGLKHYPLKKFVAHTQTMLKEKGIKAAAETLTGYPAEQLSQFAEEHDPDLIVLGAKGLRAALGILLGGVAQQMVEYAECPVLVVRAPYTGMRRILLVTDGSPCSERAVEYLARFPLAPETAVNILHVLPPHPIMDHYAQPWSDGEIVSRAVLQEYKERTARQFEEEERRGEELLSLTQEHARNAGIDAETQLLRGDAAAEIIAYARANEIDLIVAGSRGLSRLQSLLLGSVSRKLVHYAGCSVLVVKEGCRFEG